MLKLKLTALPASILGIYGSERNELPERMRYLHPDAAASYMAMEAGPQRLRVSDMWRSAEASLRARSEKRGVQPPGRSGHNFGFCIDLDVDWMLKQYRWSKQELDRYMNEHGWYCHRKDHERESESWHFNFFGAESAKYLAAAQGSRSTAAGLEQKIQDVYGSSFKLSASETQAALQGLKLYGGAIDGEIGPLAREALMAFQRSWSLPSHGDLDADTQRLLVFVTSERLA
jgi:hypothetical protein